MRRGPNAHAPYVILRYPRYVHFAKASLAKVVFFVQAISTAFHSVSMDRSYASKAGKSQGRTIDNFKASELPKIGIYQPSDKRLVLPFAKKTGGATKQKSCASTIDDINYSNTCDGVDSLPKIVITPVANAKRSDTKPANKKHFLPLIKAPLYPRSLLQHRITAAPLRHTLSAKPVSLVPLRAKLPIDRAVKPNKPLDDTKKSTPTFRLPPIIDTNIVSQGSYVSDGADSADYVSSHTVYTIDSYHVYNIQVSEGDTSECRMTPEQEWIIANLLSNCSPIVQRICSGKQKGIAIPPPDLYTEDSDDEYSDDEYSDDFEEDSDSSEQEE